MDFDINQLRNAAKTGQREQVKAFLKEYLSIVKDNKDAWLLLAQLTTDAKERRSALIRVLRLDPQNTIARQEFDRLFSSSSEPQAASPVTPQPITPPTAAPTYPQYPQYHPSEQTPQPPTPSPVPTLAYQGSYPGYPDAQQPEFQTPPKPKNGIIQWIRNHPRETIIAGVVLVFIVILTLILLSSMKTNALLGRWESRGGWIEFLENGTLIINQPPNVQVLSYTVIDDQHVEIRDSNNRLDLQVYMLQNNILIFNNTTYKRPGDATVTSVVTNPARITSTTVGKITATPIRAQPQDLAAVLKESQKGWFIVVNGTPVQMTTEITSFPRTDIYSTSKYPRLTTSMPVVLIKDQYFTNHRTLEIKTIGGGTGLKLDVSDNLLRVVGASNNEPNKAGIKLGDAIIAVDGREVGSDQKLASSLLVGTFGTQARVKILSGTSTREVVIPRVVQIIQNTTNPKIEPISTSSGGFVRLIPQNPLSKGLNCYFYTYNVGINTHNEIYCFVLE